MKKQITSTINANSYTSADTMPAKLISNPDLVTKIAERSYIPPYHVQLILTNACNLNCRFCSCMDEDKSIELDFTQASRAITELAKLGMKAVTITGGGEPFVYPKFKQIINVLHALGIDIGVVTNGVRFWDIDDDTISKFTWCRISHSDYRVLEGGYQELLTRRVTKNPGVDWAFSYVVSTAPNIKEITQIINFANTNNFTHVRLVADLFIPEFIDLAAVKSRLTVDDSKVIYQSRNMPEKGMDCWIAYLKPVIGADGKVYRCCGVQYALDPPSRSLPKELCMGNIYDLEGTLTNYSTITQGHQCVRCYYGAYNRVLRAMINKTDHSTFV